MEDKILDTLDKLKKDEEAILTNLYATRGAIAILTNLLEESKNEKTNDSGDKK